MTMTYDSKEFVSLFAEKAADSNYSRHAKLRDFSQHDIQATAGALWAHLAWRGIEPDAVTLDEQTITTALLARVKRYGDGGELVAREFGDFWDDCDEQPLSSATMDMIREDLVAAFMAGQRKAGMIGLSNLHGIWLFDNNTIWKG